MFGLLSNNNIHNNNDNNNNNNNEVGLDVTDDFVPYKFLVPLSDNTLPQAPSTASSLSSSARSPSPFRSTLNKLSRMAMFSNRSINPTNHSSSFSSSSTLATVDICKNTLDSSSNTLNQSTPMNDLEGTATSSTTTDDDTYPFATRGWSSSLISSVSASAQTRFSSPLRLSSLSRFNRLLTPTSSIANRITAVHQDNTMTTSDPVDLSSAIDTSEQSVPYKFMVPSSSSSSSSTNDFPSQSITVPTQSSPTTNSCRLSFFLNSPTKNSRADIHAEVPISTISSSSSSNNNNNYTSYITRSFHSTTSTSITMDDQHTIQQHQQNSLIDEKHGSSWPYLTGPHHTVTDNSPISSSSSSSFSSPLSRSKGRLIKTPTMSTIDETTTHGEYVLILLLFCHR